MTKKHDEDDEQRHNDKHGKAQQQSQHQAPAKRDEHDKPSDRDDPKEDPKTFADKRAVPPGFRSDHPTGQSENPGQLNRDNVNPNIPSAPPREGQIVDPARFGESHGGGAPTGPAPRDAEVKPAFPFTASVNEPQAVSLPLPEGVEVPKPSISSLSPAECATTDDDFTLDVSGENFFADSVIHFAGHDEPTTFNKEEGTLSTGIKPSLWDGQAPLTVQVIIKNGPEASDPVDFNFTDATSRKKGKHKE